MEPDTVRVGAEEVRSRSRLFGSEGDLFSGRLGFRHNGESAGVAGDGAPALGVTQGVGQDGAHATYICPAQSLRGLCCQEVIDHLGRELVEPDVPKAGHEVGHDDAAIVGHGVVRVDPGGDDGVKPSLEEGTKRECTRSRSCAGLGPLAGVPGLPQSFGIGRRSDLEAAEPVNHGRSDDRADLRTSRSFSCGEPTTARFDRPSSGWRDRPEVAGCRCRGVGTSFGRTA